MVVRIATTLTGPVADPDRSAAGPSSARRAPMFKLHDATREQIGFLESAAARMEGELTEASGGKRRNELLFLIAEARARIQRLKRQQVNSR